MQIEAQVDDFVGNLQRLIYETAVEAVQRATAAKSQARAQRQVSARRSTQALTSMTDQLYRAVCEQPGESMQAFGQTLGYKPRELLLCMRVGCLPKGGSKRRMKGKTRATFQRMRPLSAPARPGKANC